MNKCGECNVCCKACYVDEIKKPAGVLCWLYKDGGCSAYDTRPKDCATYRCIWITQENIDTKYRPDNLGVVFEQPLGKTFWVGYELEDGALEKEDTKRLVRAMNNDKAVVVLKSVKGKKMHSIPTDVAVNMHELYNAF